MPEFDPMRMHSYTASEIADFIDAGLSKEELYANGYPASKCPELEDELAARELKVVCEKDETMWRWACNLDSMSAYEEYITKFSEYDTHYNGIYVGNYVNEANLRLKNPFDKRSNMLLELLELMKTEPQKFSPQIMRLLMQGTSDDNVRSLDIRDGLISNFIKSGETVSIDDLRDHHVIPHWWNAGIVNRNRHIQHVSEKNFKKFPLDKRIELYTVGIPGSGKSTLQASILHRLFRTGMLGTSPCKSVCKDDIVLENCKEMVMNIERRMCLPRTPRETLSVVPFDYIPSKHISHPLCFVDFSGEKYMDMIDSYLHKNDEWTNFDGFKCLKSNNKKILIFVIDCSVSMETSDGLWNDLKQQSFLNEVLDVLQHDGAGKDGKDGCTMSKVISTMIVMTKTDLLDKNLSLKKRLECAIDLLHKKYQKFIDNLKSIGYVWCLYDQLYLFNTGRQYVADTFEPEISEFNDMLDWMLDWLRTMLPQSKLPISIQLKNSILNKLR